MPVELFQICLLYVFRLVHQFIWVDCNTREIVSSWVRFMQCTQCNWLSWAFVSTIYLHSTCMWMGHFYVNIRQVPFTYLVHWCFVNNNINFVWPEPGASSMWYCNLIASNIESVYAWWILEMRVILHKLLKFHGIFF